MKLSPKLYVPVVVIGGAGVAALGWLARQRAAQSQYVSSVILAFETSLRAYVAAAQAGVLDSAIIERLASDLDGLQALSSDGKKVEISLDALVPLFELVIAHTSKLAEARTTSTWTTLVRRVAWSCRSAAILRRRRPSWKRHS